MCSRRSYAILIKIVSQPAFCKLLADPSSTLVTCKTHECHLECNYPTPNGKASNNDYPSVNTQSNKMSNTQVKPKNCLIYDEIFLYVEIQLGTRSLQHSHISRLKSKSSCYLNYNLFHHRIYPNRYFTADQTFIPKILTIIPLSYYNSNFFHFIHRKIPLKLVDINQFLPGIEFS